MRLTSKRPHLGMSAHRGMSGRCVHRFNPESERRRCVNHGGVTHLHETT